LSKRLAGWDHRGFAELAREIAVEDQVGQGDI
jgi:hypothetical protein